MSDVSLSEETDLALYVYTILREDMDGVTFADFDAIITELLTIAYDKFRTRQQLKNKFTAELIPTDIYDLDDAFYGDFY